MLDNLLLRIVLVLVYDLGNARQNLVCFTLPGHLLTYYVLSELSWLIDR